ncbi:MAG: LysR family transcriptional regulator, partial [Polaromonas sp.]|nr:LysR family transcriptional regulator [Polaromonas sp.]
MYIDGRRLHYFVTVAKLGSLGRAAEVLHIAQPALSRQMRLLEEDVGVELMKRSVRGMALTAAGRAYLQSAQRLLDDGAAAATRAVAASQGDVGHLSLGFSELYAWHPEVLRALHTYRRDSPGVVFTIEAMLSGAVTDRVLDGHLDMALAYTGTPDADSPLQQVPWMTDDYLLAVHKTSALASRPPRRMSELNGEDFIMFRRDQSPRLHDLMIHHFHQRGFSPHITQEGTSHYTVLGLVAAGLGCTIIPASAAKQRLPPGVKLLRVPDFDIRMPIHLV